MTSWENNLYEKKVTAADKKKAGDKVIADLRKEKKDKKTSDKKEKSDYTDYLKQQLEFKKQKYEDQKKRQIEKLKGKGKEDVEKSKERAMQSLRNVKMQRISSTDKGATAMQKAGENLASLAGGVAGAAFHGARALMKKRKLDKKKKETEAKQADKKEPGTPGRPKKDKVDTSSKERETSREPQKKKEIKLKRLKKGVEPKKLMPSSDSEKKTEPTPKKSVSSLVSKKPKKDRPVDQTIKKVNVSVIDKPKAKLSGTPERKKLDPAGPPKLPPAGPKKLPPAGGTTSSSEESLGQKARKDKKMKEKLIKDRRTPMESYSNWREEFLHEVEDKLEKEKVIDIMKGKNKVIINPDIKEGHSEIASGEMKDKESYMAEIQLQKMERAIAALRKKMVGKDQQLPAWVQSKITKASDYIDTASDYMQSDVKEELGYVLSQKLMEEESRVLLQELPGYPNEGGYSLENHRKREKAAKEREEKARVAKEKKNAALRAADEKARRAAPAGSSPAQMQAAARTRMLEREKARRGNTGGWNEKNLKQTLNPKYNPKTIAAAQKAQGIKPAIDPTPPAPPAPAPPAPPAPAPPAPAKQTGNKKADMASWAKANPKLAAAKAERDRIRGTRQTDNPLMKNMRSRLPMKSPSVQSPAVSKLGKGYQSLVNNPNALKAATPKKPTPGSVPKPPAPKVVPPKAGSVSSQSGSTRNIRQHVEYPEISNLLSEIKGGLWEGKKSEMPCNKPKAQAHGSGETGKSHVVKACEDGKEKLIRFGQLGVKGSPKKEGESDEYASRRKRFKTRHAKNIAKGKMSAAYWANKVKW